METKLYRHFDKDGTLLYVGISLSVVARLGQHKDHAHWYGSITNVTIETFGTREDALAAESEAITKENPLHNIRGKKQAEAYAKAAVLKEAEKSRHDLIKRYVEFKPLYADFEVASVLSLVGGKGAVNKLIDSKKMGHVMIQSPRGKPHRYVTGWQLINYIEELEKKTK